MEEEREGEDGREGLSRGQVFNKKIRRRGEGERGRKIRTEGGGRGK